MEGLREGSFRHGVAIPVKARAVHGEVSHVEQAAISPPALAIALDIILKSPVRLLSQVKK